jgi:hypothetical protein
MPTTKTGSTPATDTHSTTERFKALSSPFIEESRKVGGAALDSYERQVRILTDFQTKVADVVNVEPAASITAAYADLTRDLTDAQVSAARRLLRI